MEKAVTPYAERRGKRKKIGSLSLTFLWPQNETKTLKEVNNINNVWSARETPFVKLGIHYIAAQRDISP